MKIKIIGCGNMGEIIIKSLIRGKFAGKKDISVYDIDKSKTAKIKKKYSVKVSESESMKSFFDIVILAVKPQDIKKVLKKIAVSGPDFIKLVISIAAGIKISFIEKNLGCKIPVIRVMPNTGCAVGEGISAVCTGKFAREQDILTAEKIFSFMGYVERIKEKDIDVVTAVSGSGPGYASFIIKNFIEAACSQGLKKTTSEKFVLKVFKGTLKMLEEEGIRPEELVKKVASKGGTTQAALNVFKNKKIEQIIKDAVKAAVLRSKKLSEKNK